MHAARLWKTPSQRGGLEKRRRRLLERILSGRSDANIPFEQTRTLLKALGFEETIEGSHHGYRKEGIPKKLVIQPREAKVKLLIEYGLAEEEGS